MVPWWVKVMLMSEVDGGAGDVGPVVWVSISAMLMMLRGFNR